MMPHGFYRGEWDNAVLSSIELAVINPLNNNSIEAAMSWTCCS